MTARRRRSATLRVLALAPSRGPGGGGGGRGGSPAPPRGGLTSRGILLFLVLFVLAATAVYPLRQYIAQQARIERLQAKQAALDAANADLERQRARLNDPAYVEQLAKRDFHMVEPGEQAWLLTGTPPADKPAAPAAEAPRKVPWYQHAWDWLTGRSR